MLSPMSRNLRAGFLKGTYGVAQDVVAEQRFERSAVHHVGAVEQLAEMRSESGVGEQPDIRREIHKDIDIARGIRLASRNGPEYGSVFGAESP
jgi:hypothetical protein